MADDRVTVDQRHRVRFIWDPEDLDITTAPAPIEPEREAGESNS